MTELTATRTLVKSAPELWAECSDAASLARHLGAFGEIRITKLEPETAVAWEGTATRGTVRLEPAGWGTRVVLTAAQAQSERVVPAAPEPEPTAEPAPARGRLQRMLAWWSRRQSSGETASGETASGGTVSGETASGAPASASAGASASAALDEALDSLGRAHHRPYSRS